MTYPFIRPRRLRQADWIRQIVSESYLKPSDLILPVFITDNTTSNEAISTMPGIERFSMNNIVEHVKVAYEHGIKLIALFPSISLNFKSNNAEEAYNEKNIICQAIRLIKQSVPNIGVMADVALDPYTIHGHDGIVIDNRVDNEATIEVLIKQAIVLAKSGCDVVAPSDMMDGRIKMIRGSLESSNFKDIIIMSYAVKYASAFYGPFRDAVKSKLANKSYLDKRSYQMDIHNRKEAIKEILIDDSEGADMLIIKPGMPYLDIIYQASKSSNLPIIAYQVSGEYSMIKYAATNGAIDFYNAMIEALTAFKRAGASAVISYAALDIAKKLIA